MLDIMMFMECLELVVGRFLDRLATSYMASLRFIMNCFVLIWSDWYIWFSFEVGVVRGFCTWKRNHLIWHGSDWVMMSTKVGNFGVIIWFSTDNCCCLMYIGYLVYGSLDIVEYKGYLELVVGFWCFRPATSFGPWVQTTMTAIRILMSFFEGLQWAFDDSSGFSLLCV